MTTSGFRDRNAAPSPSMNMRCGPRNSGLGAGAVSTTGVGMLAAVAVAALPHLRSQSPCQRHRCRGRDQGYENQCGKRDLPEHVAFLIQDRYHNNFHQALALHQHAEGCRKWQALAAQPGGYGHTQELPANPSDHRQQCNGPHRTIAETGNSS